MADSNKLPHLIRLLDDPSELVQEALAREFAQWGPGLEKALAELDTPLHAADRQRIERLVGENGRIQLRAAWGSWYELATDSGKLETALSLLASFQNGPEQWITLGNLLDDLAFEFRSQYESGSAVDLARFLFEEKGLKGAASEDYYSPLNSNLVYVIEARRGIPISLACVYLLVGDRLGFQISGCNWPGHFLAVILHENQRMVVDCFHGGHAIDEDGFLRMQGPSQGAAREVVQRAASAESIIARVLSNLIRAYEIQEHWPNRQLMAELLQDLERRFFAAPQP